jgi:hypothetical protein
MPSQLHWSWSGESSARVGVFFDVVCEVSGRVLEMVEGGAEFGLEDRSMGSFAIISVPSLRPLDAGFWAFVGRGWVRWEKEKQI